MKKILTLLLSLLMILSLVGCNSKKEEEPTHIHQYEVDEDGVWICTEDSNILSNTDKPYVAVLENNEPKDVMSLDNLSSTKINLGNGTIYKKDNTVYYDGGSAQTIIIKTEKDNKNNEDKVVINAPNDTVYHYGSSSVISLDAVATNSFHEYGKVDLITLTVARIVLETLSNVKEIYLDINNPNYNYESAIIALKEEVEIPKLSRDTVDLKEGEVKTLAVIQQLKDETKQDNTVETKTEEESFVKIENIAKSDNDLIIQAFLSPSADTKDNTKLEKSQTSTTTLEEAKEGSSHPASKNTFVSKDEKVIEVVKPQETSKKDETKQETKQETKPVVTPSVTPKQEETKKDDPTPTPTPTVTNYTVSFNLNGITGTTPDSQTIVNGSLVTKPDDPTYANHTFAGWYKTKNQTTGVLSDPWDFNTDVVTDDMSLYAKWTRTIESIIQTINNFPESSTIPSDAWINSSNTNVKVYKAPPIGPMFSMLCFVNASSSSDNELLCVFCPSQATKIENSYIYNNDESNYLIIFNMTDVDEDELDSIKIEAQAGANEKITKAAGTYTVPVSVTSVSLNEQTLTLEVDDDETLIATVLPENATNKNVTWSSSNESVATVNNGTVSAIAAGTAIITVTTEDDSKTATCMVTVLPAPKRTVTFDMNNVGTAPDSQQIDKYGKVTKPTDPTDDVHTFAGWYKTKDATTGALSDPWDFDNDVVTDDMTLYAKWTRTLESIYTNSDIPKVTNNSAPDNAWVNSDGGKAFIAHSTGNAVLYLYKQLQPSGAKQLSCGKDENFTKIGDDYVLDYYLFCKFYGKYTLHMTEGKFTSVTYNGTGTDYEVLSGKYSAESGCIAAGTMISMPGGMQKAVEELEIGDIICTFDHETGEVSSAPVAFIWESRNVGNAFTLTFEGDIEVTVIEEHGFYDQEEQKYVFINLQNAEEYIGHHFYNADTNSWLELKSCEALNDNVDAYAIITSGHLNHMSNGMLSMCDGSVKVLANIFEYDNQMKFDADKKKADIEAYGLTSKEKIMEFEGFFESDYDDYNLQYLNVAIGKGLTTWEWIKAFSDYCVANGL